MKFNCTVPSDKIKELICEYLNRQLGELTVKPEDVRIEVKSKQNYKAVWEEANIQATNEPKPVVPEFKATISK